MAKADTGLKYVMDFRLREVASKAFMKKPTGIPVCNSFLNIWLMTFAILILIM